MHFTGTKSSPYALFTLYWGGGKYPTIHKPSYYTLYMIGGTQLKKWSMCTPNSGVSGNPVLFSKYKIVKLAWRLPQCIIT